MMHKLKLLYNLPAGTSLLSSPCLYSYLTATSSLSRSLPLLGPDCCLLLLPLPASTST
jgi:hypothetical protein